MNISKEITIGLLWHSLSSGNLGVGALTESNIAIIRSAAEHHGINVRFIVFGVNDVGLPSLAQELGRAGHSLECRKIRMFRRSFRSDLHECDLVLDIGAGDSFADIYGFNRFFYYWLSKNIVKYIGKPIALSPQTIGPFDSKIAKILARQAMQQCDRVFARDDLSSAYLRNAGIIKNASEAVDVAFKLPFTRNHDFSDGRIHVGLNVSGLLFNGGYTGTNQFGLSVNYQNVIRGILFNLTDRPDVCVHLIGHVIEPHMPVEDDIAVCEIIKKEFPKTVMAPVFTRPSEAKSYISGLSFFTGARMHACIAAFSSGVAVIPMAYSRKFNGLFGSLGYKYLADLKTMDDTQVIASVINGIENREQLRTAVVHGNEIAQRKITEYENYLSQKLSEIKSGNTTRSTTQVIAG